MISVIKPVSGQLQINLLYNTDSTSVSTSDYEIDGKEKCCKCIVSAKFQNLMWYVFKKWCQYGF
jgi:hypothetical protein